MIYNKSSTAKEGPRRKIHKKLFSFLSLFLPHSFVVYSINGVIVVAVSRNYSSDYRSIICKQCVSHRKKTINSLTTNSPLIMSKVFANGSITQQAHKAIAARNTHSPFSFSSFGIDLNYLIRS